MQNVSQYYLDAITSNSRQWAFKIFVKHKKEYSVRCTLTGSDIVIGSIEVNRIALKDTYFGVSGAGSAKLSFKLTSSGILKMEAVNRLCKTTFLDFDVWLKTADPNQNPDDITENLDHSVNETGRVHIGEFHIVDVKSSAFECSITAYDAMIAFDRYIRSGDRKMLNNQEHSFTYILEAFCARCSKGVYNVVLDTSVDFTQFLNGSMNLGVDKDQKFNNYREVIIYIAQLLGCFAYITRDGKLSFRSFSRTADTSLASNKVFEHEMGGVYYEVYDLEMDCNGIPYTPQPATNEPDNPATVKLNENPFIRKLEPESDTAPTDLQADTKVVIDNIYSSVVGQKFNGGSFTGMYHPEYDLGDMLSVTVRAGINHQTLQDVTYPYVLISEMTEKYIQSSTIKSYDYCGDIDINAKGSNFKGAAGGGGGGGGSSAPLASVVHIGGRTAKEISTIDTYIFTENNTNIRAEANMPVLAFFTGTFVAETDTHLILGYSYDNVDTYPSVEFNLKEGRNTISFSVGFDATDVAEIHHFGLKAKVDHGTISLAKADHQLNVYSSGASSTEPTWSGYYPCQDVVPSLSATDSYVFNSISDEDISVDFDVE